MPAKLVNGVLFQIGWFVCVLGGDLIALIATSTILLVHMVFVARDKTEICFIVVVTIIGFGLDSSLKALDVLNFPQVNGFFIPLWLVCLWALFATTLNHSLTWLHSRIWLAALFGACCAPVSYFAGSQLAAVTLLDPVIYSLLPIGFAWFLLLPMLYWLSAIMSSLHVKLSGRGGRDKKPLCDRGQ